MDAQMAARFRIADLQNSGPSDSGFKSTELFAMSCRLLRLLREMHNHTIELFRVLFYQPRFMSCEVEDLWKSAMADAHCYIHSKLCGFDNYIEAIANSSICSPSYPFHAFGSSTILLWV